MSTDFKKQNVDKMLDELFSESTPKRARHTATKSVSIALEQDVMGSFVNKNMFDKKKDAVCNPLAHVVVLNSKGK